jgi:hypothetical protein
VVVDATTTGRMIMITVETVNYHGPGEPFRIVRPQATISGETAAELRVFAIGDADIPSGGSEDGPLHARIREPSPDSSWQSASVRWR